MKRKSYVRKRGRVAKRGQYGATNFGSLAHTGFRNNRVPYRRWLRTALRATDNQQHYRSIQTLAAVVVSGAATGTWTGMRAGIPGSFWTTTGGFVNTEGWSAIPTFISDLYIRGGKLDLIVTNTNTGNLLEVTTWVGRFKSRAYTSAIPASTTNDAAWDPSLIADFQGLYSFSKPVVSVVLPLNSCTRTEYVSGKKVDLGQWNSDVEPGRPFWIIKLVNLNSAAAMNTNIESRHSISFSGDATAP